MPKLPDDSTNDVAVVDTPKAAKPKPPPKKKPVKSIAAAVRRGVLYPELGAILFDCKGTADNPAHQPALTGKKAMEMLGWERESAYAERMQAEARAKGEKLEATPSFGDGVLNPKTGQMVQWLLKEEIGDKEKVVCWRNGHNRRFREPDARKYTQDTLNRNWAGPGTMPEEVEFTYEGTEPYEMADGTVIQPGDKLTLTAGTVNGETIIISRSGEVISGQHRLIGLALAWQIWLKQQALWQGTTKRPGPWPPEQYPDGPVLETLVVTGVADDPRVITTIDNGIPRQLSDTVYSSQLFRTKMNGEPYTPDERVELARTFDAAVDLLWERVVRHDGSYTESVQTHRASFNFAERHKKVEQCVRVIFEFNSKSGGTPKAIQTHLGLLPGQCAALLYLMGSSTSDLDAYRNASPPSEKKLDWDRWDRACEFWDLLRRDTDAKRTDLHGVREYLAALRDPDTDAEVGKKEKLTVLAKAWAIFAEDSATIDDADIALTTGVDYTYSDSRNRWVFTANVKFGGIDQGRRVVTVKNAGRDEEEEERERIREEKDEQLRLKTEAMNERIRAKKKNGNGKGNGEANA